MTLYFFFQHTWCKHLATGQQVSGFSYTVNNRICFCNKVIKWIGERSYQDSFCLLPENMTWKLQEQSFQGQSGSLTVNAEEGGVINPRTHQQKMENSIYIYIYIYNIYI